MCEMFPIRDCLIVSHADDGAIVPAVGVDALKDLQEGTVRRMQEYLSSGKRVFFTEYGRVKPSYLERYYRHWNVIWVSAVYDGSLNHIRQRIVLDSLVSEYLEHKTKQVMEIIWGDEFACLWITKRELQEFAKKRGIDREVIPNRWLIFGKHWIMRFKEHG